MKYSSKISNKEGMPTFISFIQHGTESSRQKKNGQEKEMQGNKIAKMKVILLQFTDHKDANEEQMNLLNYRI